MVVEVSEAKSEREAKMIETSVSDKRSEETPVTAPSESTRELKRVIEARVLNGYKVESLGDSRAVLVVNGRKRLLGLRRGHEHRTEVTINEHGRAITRNL